MTREMMEGRLAEKEEAVSEKKKLLLAEIDPEMREKFESEIFSDNFVARKIRKELDRLVGKEGYESYSDYQAEIKRKEENKELAKNLILLTANVLMVYFGACFANTNWDMTYGFVFFALLLVCIATMILTTDK